MTRTPKLAELFMQLQNTAWYANSMREEYGELSEEHTEASRIFNEARERYFAESGREARKCYE